MKMIAKVIARNFFNTEMNNNTAVVNHIHLTYIHSLSLKNENENFLLVYSRENNYMLSCYNFQQDYYTHFLLYSLHFQIALSCCHLRFFFSVFLLNLKGFSNFRNFNVIYLARKFSIETNF